MAALGYYNTARSLKRMGRSIYHGVRRSRFFKRRRQVTESRGGSKTVKTGGKTVNMNSGTAWAKNSKVTKSKNTLLTVKSAKELTGINLTLVKTGNYTGATSPGDGSKKVLTLIAEPLKLVSALQQTDIFNQSIPTTIKYRGIQLEVDMRNMANDDILVKIICVRDKYHAVPGLPSTIKLMKGTADITDETHFFWNRNNPYEPHDWDTTNVPNREMVNAPLNWKRYQTLYSKVHSLAPEFQNSASVNYVKTAQRKRMIYIPFNKECLYESGQTLPTNESIKVFAYGQYRTAASNHSWNDASLFKIQCTMRMYYKSPKFS